MTDNQRLKFTRKHFGKSQQAFAEPMDMTQSAYSDVETGKNSISYQLLIRLLDIYDVNPIWIMKGEGNQFMAKVYENPPVLDTVMESPAYYSEHLKDSSNKSVANEIEKVEIDEESKHGQAQEPIVDDEAFSSTSTENTSKMTPHFELTQMQRIINSQKTQLSALRDEVETLTELVQAYRMEAMNAEKEDKEILNFSQRKTG